MKSILLGGLRLRRRRNGLGARWSASSTDVAAWFALEYLRVLLDGAELPLESSFGRAEVLSCLLHVDLHDTDQRDDGWTVWKMIYLDARCLNAGDETLPGLHGVPVRECFGHLVDDVCVDGVGGRDVVVNWFEVGWRGWTGLSSVKRDARVQVGDRK